MSDLDYFISLTNKIDGGDLDKHLHQILAGVKARIEFLQSDVTISDFNVGETVILNERCGLPDLRGAEAVIVEVREDSLVVTFPKPIEKFRQELEDGSVRSRLATLPLDLVDKVV